MHTDRERERERERERDMVTTAHSWFWGRYEPESMTNLSSFLVAILTVGFALIWWWRKAREDKLPPGPRGVPLLGSLPFIRPDLHRYLAELAQTYGPVLRLHLGSRLCIVLSSPEAAKEALKDQDIVFTDHDVPAVAWEMYAGNGILWVPHGPHWRMIRKVCVRELLSPTNLEGLYSLRRREVRRMVDEVCAKAGEPVDLRELLFSTMLNLLTSMLWGGTVEGEEEERRATVTGFREAVDAIGELEGLPNLSDFFPALARFDLQGLQRKMRAAVEWADRILTSIVDQRLRTMEGREAGGGVAAGKAKDFLQVMLEAVRKGDPQAPLTTEHVKALLLDMVVAGTDTSSASVEWAMAELISNPEKMRKAKEEIIAVVGKEGVVEESDLPKLQYLDAIVKEVFRLHPAGPLLVPYRPSSSATIGGYTIPKGTKVFVNSWAIQTDPRFWDDASKFEPERFLAGACSKLEYNGKSFVYLPFGAGRRVCPGIYMGDRMVKYMLASLLHSVNWTLPSGEQSDLTERFGLVLKMERALVAVPTLS